MHESPDAATDLHGQPGRRGSTREVVRHGVLGRRPPPRDRRWKVKEVGEATGSVKINS